MNCFRHYRDITVALLNDMAAAGELPQGLDFARVAVEPPREAAHGDLATNAAMVLAKPAGLQPRKLAEALAAQLGTRPEVTAAEVAGPGFINLRLEPAVWQAELADLLRAGSDYGRCDLGRGEAVNVEYVSANPTGRLHIGHARGAVYGDALSALLERAGYKVTREYYVNDAGAQIEALADSWLKKYRSVAGEQLANDASVSAYLSMEVESSAAASFDELGQGLLTESTEVQRQTARTKAVEDMMKLIREDLEALGIKHDKFRSEREVIAEGGIERVISTLKARNLLYTGVLEPPKGKTPEDWEPRPQLLFKATQFGDDVDRPLAKSDGTWTYFAGDMAYHLDKFERGFASMINVWGADHGGYVKRMTAAVKALTDGKGELDIKLCQLVRLLRGGEQVKMSKRAGTVITLREVIDEVGKDVVRFIMLTRKNDAPLDFDLQQVLEQSRDNPVFYVQYAHARARSVLRHAAAEFPQIQQDAVSLAGGPLNLLTDSEELGLMKLMAGWPRLLESAAEAHEPHRVAFYLNDLAAAFHGLWNKGKDDASLRFLIPGEPALTAARLALVQGVAFVIAAGLGIFGVEPVEEMR